jgi:septum site-determining protein MinC
MFRGASFMALVLKPEMPTDRWLAELDQCLSRSPEFFEGKPVLIDISGLSLTKRKFAALAAELKAREKPGRKGIV